MTFETVSLHPTGMAAGLKCHVRSTSFVGVTGTCRGEDVEKRAMQNRARLISRIYAVLVLLLGCAFTLIGLMMLRVVHIGSEPAPIIAGFLAPGLAFVTLGVFIWLRRTWALSIPWVLALLYWLLIWSQDRSNLPLIIVPAAFGLLDLYIRRLGGVTVEAGEDAPPPAGI